MGGTRRKRIAGMLKSTKKRKNVGTVSNQRHSLNPDNRASQSASAKGGPGGQRDRSTVKRLLMYKNSKPKRDRSGRIVRPAPFQSVLPSGTVARVESSVKWFGNTRLIGQQALQRFDTELKSAMADPYRVVLNATKLPISLLSETGKSKRNSRNKSASNEDEQSQVPATSGNLLQAESYSYVFGAKAQRKRPSRLLAVNEDELASEAKKRSEEFEVKQRGQLIVTEGTPSSSAINVESMLEWESEDSRVLRAGKSRRIWGELWKVVDSSDVVIQVLDARDPQGTRCLSLEQRMKRDFPHKHIVLLLNKADLVPTWALRRWVQTLSSEYPTLAFRANTPPNSGRQFGRQPLLHLLRQFAKLHIKDKKQISVGFVGYPNVGKSSCINALRAKNVCSVAALPGQTRVWQYVTLSKRIYLIDCPGVVVSPPGTGTGSGVQQPISLEEYSRAEACAPNIHVARLVVRGAVRVENLRDPEYLVSLILPTLKPQYIIRTYGLSVPKVEKETAALPSDQPLWTDNDEFLELLARRLGRLGPGGEPELGSAARTFLSDLQRGKIPYFLPPPSANAAEKTKKTVPLPEPNFDAAGEKRESDNDDDDHTAE